VTRYPAKDEMFFVQNAGARAAGTGLAKSAIIQKISLSAVNPAIASQRNASGSVKVEVVGSSPTVMNLNGESGCILVDPASPELTTGDRGDQLQGPALVSWRGARRKGCSCNVSHEPRTSLQHHR
jgi:hypothetical protein